MHEQLYVDLLHLSVWIISLQNLSQLIYRAACHYVIGFLEGKLIVNFSPSSCLINSHINNISSNSFFFDSEAWRLLCVSVIQSKEQKFRIQN